MIKVTEDIWSHFGNWWAVLIWIVLYGVFIFFLPFYRKSGTKPKTAYIAFVIAFAFEMFGIPMSMYFLTWLLGITLPEGIFWGHTFVDQIGLAGMYIGIAVSIIGVLLVVSGWRTIYRKYWKEKSGSGSMVSSGIYSYIRHPQYTGLILITFGMMLEWATLPLLFMWPVLIILYYRLARREEKDMLREFGGEYREYMQHTSMFLPLKRINPRSAA